MAAMRALLLTLLLLPAAQNLCRADPACQSLTTNPKQIRSLATKQNRQTACEVPHGRAEDNPRAHGSGAHALLGRPMGTAQAPPIRGQEPR